MKNFFQLFNLEEKFEIDLEELEKKYLQFQNEFHLKIKIFPQ
jgi:DnaJ-domain-containing protein 1